MLYRIVVGKQLDAHQKREVQKIIDTTFSEIDRTYNKWNPNSEVSKLNRAKAERKHPLSKELESFLLQTHKIVKLSGGKFDPTIEPLQRLWRSKLEKGLIPSSEEVEKVKVATGWEKIHVDSGLFWKDHDEASIDLGGIAKGYAIDLIVERLNEAGYPDVYVEWGGEIRTAGKHPEGRPWRVFVSKLGNPNPSSAVAIVDLDNQAVATSGDYLQNWTVEGTTFFHIIDPASGYPLQARSGTTCSATVIAQSCMLADALATVAMLFSSPKESREWLEKVQNEIPHMRFWVHSR
ncbi:MAG: FAD:protein FMN transferase, partial [Chlamydiae bacterium]|nr:FAD:protein FMN transferase [Chlamydiota bacterium]